VPQRKRKQGITERYITEAPLKYGKNGRGALRFYKLQQMN